MVACCHGSCQQLVMQDGMDMTAQLRIEAALRALAAGRMVLVADRRDRENEGNLVMDAAAVTVEQMAFLIRHGSGIVCTPMTDARADELDLPLMVDANPDSHGTAFTVSVDHMLTGTGISAIDRAATVRALADPATTPSDLRRPGHIFPLRAHPDRVRARPGHTEATVDILRMAGAGEVGVITELMDEAGVPLAGGHLERFAAEHGVPFVTIEEIAEAAG
jgi:3,4-dihydroxy 2-butanone 4-phosphate synthase / GTP cyclohydrolase II